jgi:DNA-binding IclR family transcriptional regulator
MTIPSDVLGRASIILQAVAANEPAGATTSDVSRATGLARPTTHRILTTLHTQGLIDRDTDGAWLLGPELYLLGQRASSRYDVTTRVLPVLAKLSQATGESAFFSARRGNETVCLIREDGSFPVRSHVLHEGVRFPLGVASAGLAILAFLGSAEAERYLADARLEERYGPDHCADAIRARMHLTREAGYAVNPGLIVEGSWGIAAAVFDASGSPRWAISLTGIEQRFAEPRRKELGLLLMRTAHQLSTILRTHHGGT